MNKLFYILVLFLTIIYQSIFAQNCNQGDQSPLTDLKSPSLDIFPSGIVSVPVKAPRDPNEIIGTKGYDALGDTLQWVAATTSLPYTIYFENDPELATAAAQKVEVRHRLHTKADISTFAVGAFGFGSHVFTVEGNRSSYQQRLDLTQDMGIYVDVVAGIDIVAGEVFWILQSIDPATGLPPQGTQQGFLPVNDENHSGEGFVSFTIKPKANACITGDELTADASIVFDLNEAIPTNVWHNTVDALPPITQLTGTDNGNNEVLLQFNGQDDEGGCGIKQYKLYVSDNYGAYSLFDTYPAGTTATYLTEYDHCYRFFCLGEDNVGNVEAMKEITEYEYGNYNLTVSATAYPAQGGTVTGGGAFLYNTAVTLTAIPNYGYEFVAWTNQGVTVSTDPTYSFAVTEHCNLVAHFELNTIEQTKELHTGWNWYSSYITYQEGAFNELEVKLAGAGPGTVIKSQNAFVSYESNLWAGSLNNLNNTQMYMIFVNQDYSFTMSGGPIDPAAYSIVLAPGWNWIAFLSDHSIPLAEAVANLTPTENDIIKSQNSFATYFENLGWVGSLTSLQPGEGYMYLNQSGVVSFTYPNNNRTIHTEIPTTTFWNSDFHRFRDNMTMMVTLDTEQFAMSDGSHEIGAFVNDDCRGSARLQYLEGINRYVAFLTLSGEPEEMISFRVYDVNQEIVVEGTAEERVTYKVNDVVGTLANPITLHFRSTGLSENGGDNFAEKVRLFPNPTKDKVTIMGNDICSVKVCDALGQIVLHDDFDHVKQVALSLSHFGTGVYMVTVSTSFGSQSVKLVVTE